MTGLLLNQIPHPGNRQEAEEWAEDFRIACHKGGMDMNFSFRFIEAG